jgi:DNA polymerase-3 subunit gamma/tau
MLEYILKEETCQPTIDENRQGLEYIAKLANGGMRDAITILDKCLSYTVELTPQSVSETMGLVGYDLLMQFVENYISRNEEVCLELIRKVYMSGMDLKLFIKQLTEFVLDIYKYQRGCNFSDLGCPNMEDIRVFIEKQNWTFDDNMLKSLIDLGVTIKWDTNPKARIEAWVIIKE